MAKVISLVVLVKFCCVSMSVLTNLNKLHRNKNMIEGKKIKKIGMYLGLMQ